MRFSRRKHLRGTRRKRKNVVRTRKQQPVVRGRKTRKIRRTGGIRSSSVVPVHVDVNSSTAFQDSPKKTWFEKIKTFLKNTRLENHWETNYKQFGDKNADELEKFFKEEKIKKDKTYEEGKEDEILNTFNRVKDTLQDYSELNEFLYKGKYVFKDKTRLKTYLTLDIPQSESLKENLGEILYDLEKKYSNHHSDEINDILSGIQEPAELSFKFINYMLFIIDQHLLNLGKVETKTKYTEYPTYKDNYKPPSSKSETNSTASETDSLK